MKKQGFTLIELLVVIAVLAIISLITVPTIGKTITSSKNKAYNLQINNMKLGAKNWGADHVYELPAVGANITKTLADLKKEGYVDDNIENPKTGKKFKDTCQVKITNTNGKLSYEVIESTC